MKIYPFDYFIFEKEGYYFIGTPFGYYHFWKKEYIPTIVKYIDSRLIKNNPVWYRINIDRLSFARVKSSLQFSFKHSLVLEGYTLFKVYKEEIQKVFKFKKYKIHHNKPSNIYNIAFKLTNEIYKDAHIKVYLTGSLLLGTAIDGFSDIDVVIVGKRNYNKIKKLLEQKRIKNLTPLIRESAEKLYYKFGIQEVSKEWFVIHNINKYEQAFYNNIQVTFFGVRNNREIRDLVEYLNKTANRELISKNVSCYIEILDFSESMFMFPILYKGKHGWKFTFSFTIL